MLIEELFISNLNANIHFLNFKLNFNLRVIHSLNCSQVEHNSVETKEL
jgi:hypothetical protein